MKGMRSMELSNFEISDDFLNDIQDNFENHSLTFEKFYWSKHFIHRFRQRTGFQLYEEAKEIIKEAVKTYDLTTGVAPDNASERNSRVCIDIHGNNFYLFVSKATDRYIIQTITKNSDNYKFGKKFFSKR